MRFHELSVIEPQIGDIVEIELGDTLVETYIEDITEDGVVVKLDETALKLIIDARKELLESKQGVTEGLNEMDKSAPQPGRDDKVSHSTYGSRDKEGSDYFKGKEAPGKPITKKQMSKDALNILKKQGVAEGEMDEAKYQGREVPLGKPMKGDVKKSKVYVRGPKGKVVKVNFGDPNMRIKKTSPKHRKSFRARHHCENPGPRWKARYWSCRAW